MSRRCSLIIWPVLVAAVALGAVGCGHSPEGQGTPAPVPTASPLAIAATSSVVQVSVDGQGFHPAEVRVAAGRPVQLVFTRTTDQTCATAVVFPSLGIHRELPLQQPTAIDVTAPASGNVAFTCGMGMLAGRLVVE